jgi:DNA polymerase-3 subunit epsilon
MSFIKGLHDVDNCIKLQKYDGEGLEAYDIDDINPLEPSNPRMRICFLDLETTGTDNKEDKIIEIAIKCIEITKENGGDVKVIAAYESLEDPGMPIPESATKINGISDNMVKGKKIDWGKVEHIFQTSQLIVAHNAEFDRGFTDQRLEISKNKIWACSINDIDWDARDFKGVKQELLCIWHGFYYEAHRAMGDVDALIHLVTHPSYIDNKPIAELIQNAKRPMCRVEATFAKYEYKNLLKKRNYRWHDPDNGNKDDKAWCKLISHEEMDTEREWLNENVYNNNFQGRFIEVSIIDKYKSR